MSPILVYFLWCYIVFLPLQSIVLGPYHSIFYYIPASCVRMGCGGACAHLGQRRTCEAGSLFPPCGSQGLDSVHRALWQVSLPTELSAWLLVIRFWKLCIIIVSSYIHVTWLAYENQWATIRSCCKCMCMFILYITSNVFLKIGTKGPFTPSS